MKINKAVIIGSGTMGSGIAAQVANAGIPVVLLDLPSKDGSRNKITENAKIIVYTFYFSSKYLVHLYLFFLNYRLCEVFWWSPGKFYQTKKY